MKDKDCHYSSAGITEEYNVKNKQVMNEWLINTLLMYVIFSHLTLIQYGVCLNLLAMRMFKHELGVFPNQGQMT